MATDPAFRPMHRSTHGPVAVAMTRPADAQGGFFFVLLIALLVLITVGLLIAGLPGHGLGG